MTDPTTLDVLAERLTNFKNESEHDRKEIWRELRIQSDKTHDWMKAMLNRLPPWAVWVGMLGAGAIGAMGMWILTHK